MSRVTSKLQVTVPKAVAERYGIRPGTEIDWVPAGDTIRVVPPVTPRAVTVEERLRLFDAATVRQRQRQARRRWRKVAGQRRGWEREDLYTRGRAR